MNKEKQVSQLMPGGVILLALGNKQSDKRRLNRICDKLIKYMKHNKCTIELIDGNLEFVK